MVDNQMVLGIDRYLHIVANDARTRPLVAIERLSGSVSEICLSAEARTSTPPAIPATERRVAAAGRARDWPRYHPGIPFAGPRM
jgi:hypothetical protein